MIFMDIGGRSIAPDTIDYVRESREGATLIVRTGGKELPVRLSVDEVREKLKQCGRGFNTKEVTFVDRNRPHVQEKGFVVLKRISDIEPHLRGTKLTFKLNPIHAIVAEPRSIFNHL